MSDTAGKAARHQRVVTFIIHLLCLVILFVLPEILFSFGRQHGPSAFAVYSKAIVYVVAFYVNYYFIVDRTLGKPHGVLRFTLYNLLLLAVAVAVLFFLQREFGPGKPDKAHLSDTVKLMRHLSMFLRDIVMLVLTIALAVAVKLSGKWLKMEARSREEEAIHRKQELDGLRSQLNPHFLFNTLNSIYALIDISPAKARDAVHELSRLLRYVLYENPSLVALGSEAAFIENYVKLQRLRLPENARLDLEIDLGDSGKCSVPPMLFVNLIENVFKHADFSAPAQIKLTGADGCAVCSTLNRRRSSAGSATGGIGLGNLKRRLELLFGSRASLSAGSADGDMFAVELKIPLTNQSNN